MMHTVCSFKTNRFFRVNKASLTALFFPILVFYALSSPLHGQDDPPNLTEGGELEFDDGPGLAPTPVPTPTPTPTPTPNPPKPKPSPGLIIVVVVIAGVVYIIVTRKRILCYPKIKEFTVTFSKNGVKVLKHKGECYLSLGDPDSQVNDAGVKIYVQVLLPHKDCRGKLSLVRNVNTSTVMEPGPNTGTMKECLSSNGKYVLDGAYPAASAEIRGIGPHELNDNDTPRMPLNPSELVKRSDHFRVVLMWQPGRGVLRFIKIPIAEIKYGWIGDTTSSDPAKSDCTEVIATTQTTLGWKLLSSGTISTPWKKTNKPPVKKPTTDDLQWKKC